MTTSGPQPWWKAILTYPPTWAAGAVVAALTAVFVVAVDPPTTMTIGLVAVVALAAIGWPLAMAATGTLSALQFATTERTDDVDPVAIASLAAELATLDDSQPAEQLAALEQKRASLLKVLDRRLDSAELTYSRYVTTAQHVYLSVLDNLGEVAVAHDSVRSIDTGYIDRRIAELDRDGSDSDSAQRERETLTRRSELRDTQFARIAQLMAQNEAALTSLDRTTTALADVPIGQRPEDADEAMLALEALADRARTYAEGDHD